MVRSNRPGGGTSVVTIPVDSGAPDRRVTSVRAGMARHPCEYASNR